jgi:hypothetical protein
VALVNFFNHPPFDAEIVELLGLGELVVFNHTRTGARELRERVECLAENVVSMHNENIGANWSSDDYFVVVRRDFSYFEVREALRELAGNWIAAGCLDQVKHL